MKLTASPGPGDLDRLDAVADLIGASHRVLISRTREAIVGSRRASCNLAAFERLLDEVAPRSTSRRGRT